MTYADGYNIRTTSVKFNDIADALDGVLTRNAALTVTGGPTVYITNPSPAWTEYVTSSFLIIIPNATNTAGSPSVTINVNSLGAKAIKRGGADIAAGTLVAGLPTILVYNGTHFEILLLQNALLLDGSNAMLANLNFGGFRPTNVAAGTAAAPAICAGNDADTGMWSPTGNELAFSTGGVERLRIGADGHVGIGLNPDYEIDVLGSCRVATPTTNATTKVGRFHGRPYTNADGDWLWADVRGEIGANNLVFGGGSSVFNCATAIRFRTAANTTTVSGTERMIIDGNGYVGIGVAVPSYQLDVLSLAGNAVALNVRGRASDDIGVALFSNNAGTETGRLQVSSTTFGISKVGNNPITFSTNSSERMRISGSGDVGIGTNSPSVDFHLYRASGEVVARSESASLANTERASVDANGGTRTAKILVYKHSGITNPCGALWLEQEDADDSYLWVTNTGLLNISSTITHIGTTSGTTVGDQTSSDERVKNINTDPFPYGLNEILALEPIAFTFKNDEEQIARIGFSAQQVRPIVSEAIHDTNEPIPGEPEGAPTKLAMSYTSIIPVLVKAIQELTQRVQDLEA